MRAHRHIHAAQFGGALADLGQLRGAGRFLAELRDFAPRAVIGRVQIGPGCQALPRFGVEAHAVMALAQHLAQFGGAEMIVQRGEHPPVALDAGTSNETLQFEIGLGEFAATVPVPGQLGLPVGEHLTALEAGWSGLGRVMTANAIAIQHRLDFAHEAESARRSVPRLDRGNTTLRGKRLSVR